VFDVVSFAVTCLQKTHQVAVQVTQKIDQLIQANHYSSDIVRSIGETISAKWQQLMFHAEERMKLVMASTNWFKTAEQVSRSLAFLAAYDFVVHRTSLRFKV